MRLLSVKNLSIELGVDNGRPFIQSKKRSENTLGPVRKESYYPVKSWSSDSVIL